MIKKNTRHLILLAASAALVFQHESKILRNAFEKPKVEEDNKTLGEENEKLQLELQSSHKKEKENQVEQKRLQSENEKLRLELKRFQSDLEALTRKQEEDKKPEALTTAKNTEKYSIDLTNEHLVSALLEKSAEDEDAIFDAVNGKEFEFPLTCPNLGDAANLVETTNSSVILGYHVGMLNNWKEIVKDQMNTLHKCGLGTISSRFYITYSNNQTFDEELNELRAILRRYTFGREATIMFSPGQPVEGTAINALHSECVNQVGKRPYPPPVEDDHSDTSPDTVAFYFHTKGSSSFTTDWRTRSNEFKCYRNQIGWRKFMEYFTIERPQVCMQKIINEKKFACGVHWVNNGGGHFYAGNFWASSCKYLASLRPLNITDMSNRKARFDAEGWNTGQVWEVENGDKYMNKFVVPFHNTINRLYKDFIGPDHYSDYSNYWRPYFSGTEEGFFPK